MVERPFWINRIKEAWNEAPVVLVAGVGRVGKTTLVKNFGEEQTYYLNCNLPVVNDMVADSELFLLKLSQIAHSVRRGAPA